MNLIVDTNIIFSAILNTNSRIANILTRYSEEIDFYSPTFLLSELAEHQVKLTKILKEEYPNKSIEFVRSVAEEDLVALHTHQIWPDHEEYITMDFFRFDENGKIIEHCDSIQKIPDKSENGNKMF